MPSQNQIRIEYLNKKAECVYKNRSMFQIIQKNDI